MRLLILASVLVVASAASVAPALATSGWGCFRVVDVAHWDVLNMRYGPSASTAIVGTIDPQHHGIIALNDRGGIVDTLAEATAIEEMRCVPASRPLASRWCSVTHFTGAGTSIGWVSRRYLQQLECP
jgi:hypothetical protein